MTLAETIKFIDNIIKANQAQYNLDRKTAKIFALSSGELENYEYVAGQDLTLKPGVDEKNKTI